MDFASLTLICTVALIASLLSVPEPYRIPVVVGEILVGIAIGATGLDLVDSADPTFTFMAQIGFALVMFVVGSNVPIRRSALRSGLTRGLARAAAVGVLAVPAGLAIAAIIGTDHGPMYAVLLASSSAAVIMPTLGGSPSSAPAITQLIPQVAIADTACIVALPLVIDPANAGRAALGAAAIIAVGVALTILFRYLVRDDHERRIRKFSKRQKLALELRFSLALLFALATLATWLNVSVMLAGFVLGVAVEAAGEPRRLARQVFALAEGLFGPLFFIWLGASLDMRDLGEHRSAILLGLLLGLGAVLVHALMTFTRQPWPIAVIASAQIGVPVSAVALGTESDLLRPGEGAAILLGALITIAATIVVSRRVQVIVGEGTQP